MLLQPTSPFRKGKTIDKAINLLIEIKILTQSLQQKKLIATIQIKCLD